MMATCQLERAIGKFLGEVTRIHQTGAATEHSYRAAIGELLDSLGQNISSINEPKQIKCGAPDFRVNCNGVAIGYVEAKNIGVDLKDKKEPNASQRKRYVSALPNLIYTDCLDWDFYRNGKLLVSVSIADLSAGSIRSKPDQYAKLAEYLDRFIEHWPLPITTPEDLARIMASKAKLTRYVLSEAMNDNSSSLHGQFDAFREHLIHGIREEEFVDIYAETIAYGMFAARLHDDGKEPFSRRLAGELLPRSNPFLWSFFNYIAGPELDDRIKWVIDDLAWIFRACDVPKLMDGFGSLTGRKDPFLHFYEGFLGEYNPEKRKSRGVWYTPEPVVHFIVRAVNDVLKSEFGLRNGLADHSKLTTHDGKQVHRVQILDPAAGTGTFLAETIKQIAAEIKQTAPGAWSPYVEEDLIPRIHGFELLMASYAMCHTKLDMVLRELGYKPNTDKPPRLSVFLTNSLEEGATEQPNIPFAQWLMDEVQQAARIKRDMPIMCVIGNPPYSGESANKGAWITNLMKPYKQEPSGGSLVEKNSKWLNDDYVKFIRLAEHLIDKNGEGVLGFITNHGYLDNPTFRGMRWHLLKTFSKIYVLDLHGNAKKKEQCPDGSPDKNVFDIQQGVAIIIAVKKSDAPDALAEVWHSEIWGDRDQKYQELEQLHLTADAWRKLENHPRKYPWIRRDFSLENKYEDGFSVKEFFRASSVGIVTARDKLTIDMERDALWQRVQDFAILDPETARTKYRLGKDVRDWKVSLAQSDVSKTPQGDKLTEIAYRPFDTRWTYYTGKTKGFHCMPRNDIMSNFIVGENIGLCISRQQKTSFGFFHAFVHKIICESSLISNNTAEIGTVFPLYTYSLGSARMSNLDSGLFGKLQGLAETPQHGKPDEIQAFDYIYAVLHCPSYRAKYREFLKTDFPYIPWPSSADEFWQVRAMGEKLRRLHLLEDEAIGECPYPFSGSGDNIVDKPKYEDGKIWINKTQYFASIPEAAWNFPVGGYHPAQKWLKDRKERYLSFSDVTHYQKIIKALSQTEQIMQSIHIAL